jgi:hypothetical protein
VVMGGGGGGWCAALQVLSSARLSARMHTAATVHADAARCACDVLRCLRRHDAARGRAT